MSDDELTPELREALEELDLEAQAASQRLNVERVSANVLARLQSDEAGASAPRNWIRIAAAIALLLGGPLLINRFGSEAVSGLPVNIDSLHASDSQAVMLAMDTSVASDTTAVTGVVTVDDLNEQELRALLQALESEESL